MRGTRGFEDMNIKQILEAVRRGGLECCKECPWSPGFPEHVESVAFGVSCATHGID